MPRDDVYILPRLPVCRLRVLRVLRLSPPSHQTAEQTSQDQPLRHLSCCYCWSVDYQQWCSSPDPAPPALPAPRTALQSAPLLPSPPHRISELECRWGPATNRIYISAAAAPPASTQRISKPFSIFQVEARDRNRSRAGRGRPARSALGERGAAARQHAHHHALP